MDEDSWGKETHYIKTLSWICVYRDREDSRFPYPVESNLFYGEDS